MRRVLFLIPALLLCACAASLPADFAGAESVALTQSECDGSPYEDFDERIEATGGSGAVEINVKESHFRCAQDVEAFYVIDGTALDVLVQPVDMNPQQVAGCDCLYDLDIDVDGLEPGSWTVRVFRRWDNQNNDNEPVEIGSASVTVD